MRDRCVTGGAGGGSGGRGAVEVVNQGAEPGGDAGWMGRMAERVLGMISTGPRVIVI